ncbi:MAG: APC family permease [Chloroflexi bacterium]|nr:MAG: APC family permease [Chloroflexota bacterium]TMD64332.1 MAG: APC family permease [Chloroflexota bacterium]
MQIPPDGHRPGEIVAGSELRRDVTVWGSYMWGYAAVGADIYTALGIITLAALGLAPLAFLAAGVVFALVGLCYAELASSYPLAGGGQYFTLRGLGDFSGLIAGAALVLDYTIDISLFTVVAFGYFNYFLPWFTFGHHAIDFTLNLGQIHLAWLWLLESVAGILLLIWLNVRGIKVSTNFNEVIGTIAIVAQTVIVLAGFALVWKPEIVSHEFLFDRPSLSDFAFGSSLAIIAFVGLETISQVAQETRRPATIIPRTSIGLVLSVLLFAMAFSVLAIGLVHPTEFRGHEGDPVALIASRIPIIGIVAAPLTAAIGALIVFISANSGVVSSSRLSYSMAQFDLLPTWFAKVSRKFQTPARAVIVFGGVALLQTVFAFFTPGPAGKTAAIDVLADLYAFGATTGYLLVFISLFVLRFKDPFTPRPYKMPLNIRITYKGNQVWFPVLGVLGFLGVLFFLVMVVLTHQYARIVGPLWVLAAIGLFAMYRRKRGLPIFKTLPRDWVTATRRVLLEAEEFQSLEEYDAALQEHRERSPGQE